MESTNSTTSVSKPSRKSSKRLLFDRRYGWVIDEWKDPSEEALDGGRGMFCILPLARTLVQKASETINHSATLAIKAFEKPELFSPQTLQAAFDDGLRKFTSTLKNAGSKCNILSKNSHSHTSSN
ncbi:retrotransposon protein putative Ty1-copia subclass [Senna tora]|uniref:Retrotransposon protein putative Ty1-copia subclass n=1 Tax=Senna tora TaxID=362788 RepID=A0A834TNX5_9FABA|nr:retrotransposon protein putative Ty1-copia subclass [Senna tora]